WMGEEISVDGPPRIEVRVRGTARLAEVEVIRDGDVCHRIAPARRSVRFEWTDNTFAGKSWYYLRVVQADADEYGNPSLAWSSPIWVSAGRHE
ncbi:MAG: hypothetical protein M1457_07685, partial [bacterium]|nr:hypothetical protein [bacterium]